jgi:hypothetical protein
VSIPVEFGAKAAADNYREEHSEHVCPEDDDKRLKTVHFKSDTPDWLIEQARAEADEGLAAREATVGQSELTDAEKDRIDFSKGRANIPWAQSIKALAEQHNVSDWTAHIDPTLTVDEHRDVMERAGRQGGGARDEGDQRDAERERRAAATEQAEGCDHARKKCVNDNPGACEFLKNRCGYSQSEVSEFLSDDDVDDPILTDAEKGALSRSWNGYKGAVAAFESALADAAEAWNNAQAAVRAINGIRDDVGQEPLDFEALEAGQADLLDLARRAARDCAECHADHGEHDHPTADDGRETLRSAVNPGGRRLAARAPPERPAPKGRDRDPNKDTSPSRVDPAPEVPRNVHLRGSGITPDEMEGSIEAPGGRYRAADEDRPTRRAKERERLAEIAARDESRESSEEWADDRHVSDDGPLGEFGVEAEEGTDSESREHRAAQRGGYLRTGDSDPVENERQGLGEYGARTADTKGLEQFEDDDT